jgi:two-component system, LytTR family, response regulator
MTLTCIIIEDEPLAVAKLEGFIARIPFLQLLTSFDNALDGLSYLKQNKVDILFLDIEMEQLTGIQLLETLTDKPYVIITTAYSDYAIKGYELRVFDYLLKPYSFERLLSAVNAVADDAAKRQNGNSKSITSLFVKTEYRIENIAVDEILYIEGMQGYLRIVTPSKKIMTKQNFKTLLAQLPAELFVQVHKSWVVSISKIESIEHNRIKIAQMLIPIGDSYRDDFYSRIQR